jgi:hypothetical protein
MYATPDQLLTALNDLSDADWIRLHGAAGAVFRGTEFGSPRDLLAHTISTAYLAACGESGRRWKPAVPLMAYLVMTIRGIASDDRRGISNRPFFARGFSSDEPDLEGRPGEILSAATPSPEDRWDDEQQEQLERQQDAASLEQVLSHFKDAPQVQWVIRGIAEGVPARKIQELSGMTQTEYQNAHKRWVRGLAQLFPARRKA